MTPRILRTMSPVGQALRTFVVGVASLVIVTLAANYAIAQSSQELDTSERFSVLSGTAVTLTTSTVLGDVGVKVAGSSVAMTKSSIVGTVHIGDSVATKAYKNFLDLYARVASDYPCTKTLKVAYTDTALTLAPGVYCSPVAVSFTRTVITLDARGDENAVWIFKVGTSGTGALTGTGLSIVPANSAQPCNVYWWTAQAATLTGSNVKGNILAGAAVTVTGGSLIGQVLAKLAVTMTGTDTVSCASIKKLVDPPVIDEESCKKFYKKPCKAGKGTRC